MSDNILDRLELKKLFFSWKQDYGDRKVSPQGTEYFVVPPKSQPRRPMLETLCRILIEQHGYVAEDFTIGLCDQIVEACINPDKEDRKKLKKWRDAVEFDLLYALGTIFPSGEVKYKDKKYAGRIQSKTNVEEVVDTPTPRPMTPDAFTKPIPADLNIGFGKVRDKMTEENLLAVLEEGNNE